MELFPHSSRVLDARDFRHLLGGFELIELNGLKNQDDSDGLWRVLSQGLRFFPQAIGCTTYRSSEQFIEDEVLRG
jgi:hypothetical protein